MNRSLYLSLVILLSLSAAARLNATPITVPNYSFESVAVGDGGNSYSTVNGNTTVAPNWIVGIPAPTGATGGGVYNPMNATYPGSTAGPVPAPADGSQAGFLYLDAPSTAQTLTLTSQNSLGAIQDNGFYTLTVALGRRLDLASTNLQIALLANGSVIPGATASINGATIPAGTFVNLSTSFLTAISGDPLVGQALTIRLTSSKLSSDPIGEGEFDNVRLDFIAAAPEPSSVVLLLMGLSGATVFRRKNKSA